MVPAVAIGCARPLTDLDVSRVWMSGAEQSRVCRRLVDYSVPPLLSLLGDGAVGDARWEMGGSKEAHAPLGSIIFGGWIDGRGAILLGSDKHQSGTRQAGS